MSRTTHLFLGGPATLAEVRDVLEANVGASFLVNSRGEPVVAFGSTRLFLQEGHPFDDDEEDAAWPDGSRITSPG